MNSSFIDTSDFDGVGQPVAAKLVFVVRITQYCHLAGRTQKAVGSTTNVQGDLGKGLVVDNHTICRSPAGKRPGVPRRGN